MNYKTWGIPLLIGLITALQYGFFNNHLPLTDPVETNYALTAKEMFLAHNWLSPTIYGHVWFDKPPLTYWALIISYKLFGITDWAARFPSLITSTLSTIAMYFIGKRLAGQTISGVVAAFILATCLQFWYIGHAVLTDGFLFLFSLGIFYWGYQGLIVGHAKSMIGAYICAAGAVLAKGPVGIVLPGLAFIIMGIWQVYTSQHKISESKQYTKHLFSPLGILIFASIALPWYFAMYSTHGMDFINGFLGLQNITRATVSEHPKFDVWYYYLLLTPLATLPWTPILIWQIFHMQWSEKKFQYGAIWFLTIFIFYTFVATKYITYTFIGLIPLTLWITRACICIRSKQFEDQLTLRNWLLYIPCTIYIILMMILPSVLNPSPILFHFGNTEIPIIFIYLIVGITLPILCRIFWGFSNKPTSLAIFWIIAAMIPLGLLTINIPPALQKSNGSDVMPIAQKYPHNTYIYNTYFTSIPYYTDVIPTLIRAHTNDNAKWEQGKMVMPYISEEQLAYNIKNKGDFAIIIVPNKFYRQFYSSPLFPNTELTKTTENNYVFVTKDIIGKTNQ